MSIKQQFEAALEKYQNAKKEAFDYAKVNLGAYLVSLLPDGVEEFRVAGYAPAFNDGEPCYFSVYEPEFRVKEEKAEVSEEDSEDEDHDDDFVESYSIKSEELKNTVREMKKIIGSIPDEVFSSVYGDCFRIVVSREGVNAEDYFEPPY